MARANAEQALVGRSEHRALFGDHDVGLLFRRRNGNDVVPIDHLGRCHRCDGHDSS
jgi:hypothetical protein